MGAHEARAPHFSESVVKYRVAAKRQYPFLSTCAPNPTFETLSTSMTSADWLLWFCVVRITLLPFFGRSFIGIVASM